MKSRTHIILLVQFAAKEALRLPSNFGSRHSLHPGLMFSPNTTDSRGYS